MGLTVEVEIKGLYKDINDETAKIKKQIPKALEYVGSEMQKDLIKHLEEDFYDKYSPVAYKRRYDKGLKNKENINVDVKGTNLIFSYTPKGEPQGTLKDSLNWNENLEEWLKLFHKTADTPFFSPAHNDDDLIVWAQRKHEIGGYKIPARPFWNNFIEEQKNGKIISNFIVGMSPYSMVIREIGEVDLILDGNESLLEHD